MATTSELLALIKQKKEAIAANSGAREKVVRPTTGKSRWRILPSWRKDDEVFWHDFGQHFIKDSKGELKAVYVCVDKTFEGQDCPLCADLTTALLKAGDQATIDTLNEAKSKGVILVNALRMDGSDADPKKPVILALTTTTFGKVLEIMAEDDFDGMLDLKNGRDITINREGAGLNTKYSIIPSPKQTPVDPAVMATVHNLDEYVKQEYDDGFRKARAAIALASGDASALSRLSGAPALSGPKASAPKDDDDAMAEMADEVIPPAKTASAPKADAKKAVIEEIPDAALAGDFSADEIEKLLADV